MRCLFSLFLSDLTDQVTKFCCSVSTNNMEHLCIPAQQLTLPVHCTLCVQVPVPPHMG